MEWSSMKRHFILSFAMGLAICGFGVSAALAQTGTSSTHGVVTDKSGAAIVGAEVALDNSDQGLHRATQTGAGGEYEFVSLQPGTYVLTVEMTGFRRFEQRNLQLLVNNPSTVNVTLEIGTATQTVEVSVQAQTLNTTDASLGIAFNENQVKELPLDGRNVPDLLTLQPGVVYTGNRSDIDQKAFDSRSGSVNGARSDQSNITVDGIPSNEQGGFAFKSVLPVTLDSVQEFRVTTTNYDADQGGSSGAQVALVTKSGTDSFHGSAYEYNRNTATSANDWFVKQGELNAGDPNKAPKLIRNVFGASVGGPIKKDRLFFFTNFEGTRRVEETSETQQVPSLAMRDGIIQYACATPSACPGGSVTGLSGASYSVAPGSFALNATQIAGLDPLGIGPNAVMLKYLNSFPSPNNFTTGDGFNYQGFTWRAPISDTQNVYIAKLDYNLTSSGKQRLSVSGALQNEANPQGPFLPGQAPSDSFVNYSKGITANFTSVVTSNLINSFRYGFVRQSVGDIGNTDQPVITIRGLNDQTGAVTHTQAFQRPVHNFFDDVSWNHGKHNWQFGTAISILRSPNSSLVNSFSGGSTNASWLDTAGLATKPGSPFDPSSPTNSVGGTYPAVDSGFANAYDYPMLAELGIVSEVDAQYNFDKTGKPLAQGAPVVRRYAEDSYEFYAQDSWKVKPTLTLTLGLRYSLFSPPWETNGLEVVPSINLSQWFNQRAEDQVSGIGSYADPAVSFQLGGPANSGKPGYYSWDYKNLAPRFAFAWSPRPAAGGLLNALFGDGKSSIRGGASIVYDRVGESLVNNFDSSGGAFGLSATLPNPASSQSVVTAPRVTSLNTIPTVDNTGAAIYQPAPPAGFPVTYPDIEAITSGLDQNIKTPYSYTFDLSYSRQLQGGFQLEVAYVGRLSRRLLTPDDVAMPLDLHDKASGLDYYAAVTALAKVYRAGVTDETFTPSMVSPAVAKYWADIIPAPAPGSAYGIGPNGLSGGCFNSSTPPTSTTIPVVAAFDLFCPGSKNETTPLQAFDTFGINDANGGPGYLPLGHANTFFNPQFSSLYAWRSMGFANYNAMEVTVRHPSSHGVQFDFNYTFSKSIDLSSDAERIGLHGGLGGQIINAWSPYQLRGVSDFDATHQFNSNWVVDLPFGRGRNFAPDANGFVNAIIGGWQLSGLFRLTSGFPVNVSNGAQWPTNWELGGQALVTGPVQTGQFRNSNPGAVSVFSNGTAAIDSFTSPFPGQSGARNAIRGDGYFGVDLGLSKRWLMPWNDKHSLQFRWEVFNVTNANRFDIATGSLFLDTSSTFGNYTGLLTNPRVMQFALRYEF